MGWLTLGWAGMAGAAPTLQTLVEFRASPNGPAATLVRGADGNFYGTTSRGGAGYGVIFCLSPGGALSTFVEFTGDRAPSPGNSPNGLVLGADGNFYGTTYFGGAADRGTVFRLTPAGALSTLVEFTGDGAVNRGTGPAAALTPGADGNLYGTTFYGGASDMGTVFRVTLAGELSTLVEFTGNGLPRRGAYPAAALTPGADGNLYGTTSAGGAAAKGTVFRVAPDGTLSTLVEFTGDGAANRGSAPVAALTPDADGNFLGTTSAGGGPGRGTVFRVTPAGGLTTLVEFTGAGASNRGSYPAAALTPGADGRYYGTTYFGGAADKGTVFRVTPAGELATLVEFTGDGGASLGSAPLAALARGADGSFFGTTYEGGAGGGGTVFRLTPAGALTTLAEFSFDAPAAGGGRGMLPAAALTRGADGNLYGTTKYGGATNRGTVFRVTPAGALSTLAEFTGDGARNRGAFPAAALTPGVDGNLYGTTEYGGAAGLGTVFRLTPAGALGTLAEFDSAHGTSPNELTLGPDGNFYGTTQYGGASDDGTIFRLTPAGALSTLVEFTGRSGTNLGSYPNALTLGADGNFYGTTYAGGAPGNGTVFRVTPAGALTTLVELNANRIANPYAALAAGADGSFYGTTQYGGASDRGTVFRVTPDGALSLLAEFTGSGGAGRGAYPAAALARGADGNFYGTTQFGGTANYGTVFRVTPAGLLTPLVEFTRSGVVNRGAYPNALTLGADGRAFYGTTYQGGASNAGAVFRLRFEPDGSPTQLLSVAVEPGAGTRLSWQAIPGQVSRVEYSDGLTNAWQPIAGSVTASGAGVAEYLDATQPRPAERFYRLVTPF